MNPQVLKDSIERLDPVIHRALREALTGACSRLDNSDGSGLPGKVNSHRFEDLFRKTANEIAETYVRGTMEYIRNYHPTLYHRAEEADDRMNAVWRAGLQGKVSLDEFQHALKVWCVLHLEQIELYKEHQRLSSRVSPSTKGKGQV